MGSPLIHDMRRLLQGLTVLLFIAGAAPALADTDKPPPRASLHLTHARLLVVDSPGFSTPPPLLPISALPDRWQPVELPYAPFVALIRQAVTRAPAAATRTTWFRLSVPPGTTLAGPLAIYGARVKTDGTVAVYADGQLIHRAQPMGLLWDSSRRPLWILLEGEVPHDILFRLEHSRASQVALSSLWLGPADDLAWRFRWRQWLQQELPAMCGAAFLAVGIFALFIWMRRLREPGYLLFFAMSVVAFARGLHFYVDFRVANDWFAWMTVNSLLWLVTTVHIAISLINQRPRQWLTGLLVSVTVSIGVLTLPMVQALPNTPRVTPLIYAIAALMCLMVGVSGLLKSWRHSAEGMLVSAGVLVCMLFGVTDWLLQNNFISPEGWYLGAYTNVMCFGVFTYLMNRRYIGAMAEVEQTNAQLEKRLQAREAELADSYQRLRDVEKRQMVSDERQRLTQDMHDGLGSSLVTALRVVESGKMSEAEVAQVLKSCIDDLKLTIDSMEPVEADLLLLLATLRYRLGPRLAAAGVKLHWDITDLPRLDWLDPRNALHILRTLQEAFTNILKHTSATEIRVSTGVENAGVTVTIADNGEGFEIDAAMKSGGKGLSNQVRRAQAMGGDVRWVSGTQGTRLTLWLPETRAAA
ncbi:MAG: ATP-binding protein [Pseudomonadota bacterium]